MFENNTCNATGVLYYVKGASFTLDGNNAFIDNKVEGTNAKGNDVCASVYYTDIDLSGNYWGGEAPVENDNYFVEYPDNNNVIINDYLTTYGN